MSEEERRHIENPKWLVYDQVQRILRSRAEGRGAFQSLLGLVSLLSPYRKSDPEYQAVITELTTALKKGKSNLEESFWTWFDAAIELVAKQGWWLIDEEAE